MNKKTALAVIDAFRKTLPNETDPGVYYSNKRLQATFLRELQPLASDDETKAYLKYALDLACYVGD